MEIRSKQTAYVLHACLPCILMSALSPVQSMEEILGCYSKQENPELNKQIEFIIKQLNSGQPGSSVTSRDAGLASSVRGHCCESHAEAY